MWRDRRATLTCVIVHCLTCWGRVYGSAQSSPGYVGLNPSKVVIKVEPRTIEEFRRAMKVKLGFYKSKSQLVAASLQFFSIVHESTN